MATNYLFQRDEKKYFLNTFQYQQLLFLLADRIEPDQYDCYTICNLYFDTTNFDLVRTSLDKPLYKEKLRLRSYGNVSDEDKVFLELKKKYKGCVYKRRISITYKEAELYLFHGIPPYKRNQIFHEIDYFIRFYQPKPVLYLAYDRIAYHGTDNDTLRITFDHNIRSRSDSLTLRTDEDCSKLELPSEYLMEIKVLDAMPLWLTGALASLRIYPISLSKYGKIYETQL